MSLHMIFTILQLLPLRTPTLENAAEPVAEQGWTYWLYLITSKGIYSILVSLILFCCLVNAIQNKFGKKVDIDVNIDVTAWACKFWKNIRGKGLIPCGPLKAARFPGIGYNSFELEDDILESGNLLDRVMTAETELEALRKAVDTAQLYSADLSENLEEAEKERDEIEGRSLVEKNRRASELELEKAELITLQQELLKLKAEKDEALLKCQLLKGEAQKAEVAFEKRRQMEERLEEALTVVSVLKQAVSDLEADRDEALESLARVLPDLTVPEESKEKLARLAYKVRCEPESNLSRSSCVENLHMLGQGDDMSAAANEDVEHHKWSNFGERGYGEMALNPWKGTEDGAELSNEELSGDPSSHNLNGEHTCIIGGDDSEDEEESTGGIRVTDSLAFKKFLKSNFGSIMDRHSIIESKYIERR